MSHELALLNRFMAESDPEPTWRRSYVLAHEKYDFLKWIAYPVSFAICTGLFVGAGWALANVLQPEHLRIRYMSYSLTYDALALRVLVGLTPFLPWPSWFREFGELHDALKPFDRVMRRLRGEPDPDVA